jgi:hypothetical protein
MRGISQWSPGDDWRRFGRRSGHCAAKENRPRLTLCGGAGAISLVLENH